MIKKTDGNGIEKQSKAAEPTDLSDDELHEVVGAASPQGSKRQQQQVAPCNTPLLFGTGHDLSDDR